MCFPDLHFIKRTHTSFINKSDIDHHHGTTILQTIKNIDLISDVPLDYMHLVALGVVRKKLNGIWCNGPPPHKLPSKTVIAISKNLESLSLYPFRICSKA